VFVNANPTDKVDVLVVIDNSGSMKTEQQNMKSRFSSFIDKLSGLNWQLGIITTDVTRDTELRDGRLIEMSGLNTRVLNTSMNINTVKTAFGNTIQRSESGSGSEQGIRASYRAVERSQENGS